MKEWGGFGRVLEIQAAGSDMLAQLEGEGRSRSEMTHQEGQGRYH